MIGPCHVCKRVLEWVKSMKRNGVHEGRCAKCDHDYAHQIPRAGKLAQSDMDRTRKAGVRGSRRSAAGKLTRAADRALGGET